MENGIDLEAHNEFEEQILAEGYKWFKDNLKSSIRGFQKRFTDKKGIKYFITGYHYNFAKQFPGRDDVPDNDRYSITAQFNLDGKNKAQTVDIVFSADFLPNEHRGVTTLKEAEDFFEKLWKDFGFNYNELSDYEGQHE